MGKYHDRINWKKELRLLPGYIIVCAWVALTAAILFWIVCASLSSTKEILTGRVVDFSNGLKWDNYVTAWNTQNVQHNQKHAPLDAPLQSQRVERHDDHNGGNTHGNDQADTDGLTADKLPARKHISTGRGNKQYAHTGNNGRLCCRWFSPPLLRLRFSTSCLCGTSSSLR